MTNDLLRQTWAAVRALVVFTLLLGIVYPVAVWGVGTVVAQHAATGSRISMDGRTVGSSLIGQQFTGHRWFQSRPSAVDYDADGSGASNLGPNNPTLLALVEHRRIRVARLNGVPPTAVPPDAVTASGSGLDPGISPAYAAIQVDRVARANHLAVTIVRRLVSANTHGRILGFLGEPYVHVLQLNVAVAMAAR